MSTTDSNLATVLYMALVLYAAMIAAPAAVIWWRLRGVPDFKYFRLRAALTCVSHIAEGVSLTVLVLLRSQTSLWALLIVWQLGELAKVVGEMLLAGNLYGIFNGIHPTRAESSLVVRAIEESQPAPKPPPGPAP